MSASEETTEQAKNTKKHLFTGSRVVRFVASEAKERARDEPLNSRSLDSTGKKIDILCTREAVETLTSK